MPGVYEKERNVYSNGWLVMYLVHPPVYTLSRFVLDDVWLNVLSIMQAKKGIKTIEIESIFLMDVIKCTKVKQKNL